jgi:hypothetical protein
MTMVATSSAVDSRPSETLSVVAHAGGWLVSVAIMSQLVATTDSTPLAASLAPSTDSAGVVDVMTTPGATRA